ncbi:MAG: type II toxin-antitoxin system RelE/ParE family toxin [Burkholderiaceae bacterium]|nr:type II toxin-antitoxin system RelE/ParE family toxin [Burkholderiaceae bacterium]
MATVTKRPLALADLAEIWSFIADDSEANADRFLAKLETKLQLLATQPTMGRERPELMAHMRSFPYARYVVFFIAQADGIEIVRVMHSGRDIVADDF